MATKKLGIRAAIRKRLDRALGNSSSVQYVVLIVLTAVILGVGTTLAYLLPKAGTNAVDAVWWTFNRITNPGMLPEDKGSGMLQVALSATIILCGWVVFGLLISILTTSFQERLERIRAGTSEILSAGHTVVLGWNSTVFSIMDQLAADDEGLAGDVAILADMPVQQMREEAGKYCRPGSLSMVDFRRGSMSSVKTVGDMRIQDARQVIILGSEADGDEAVSGTSGLGSGEMLNTDVLKALLACYQALSEKGGDGDGRRLPIVASVGSSEAARMLEQGVPGSVTDRLQVHAVHAADLLSRLTAQSASIPALALVYKELFSYGGSLVDGKDISSEIYVVDVDAKLVGASFEECLLAFDHAVPIGYVTDGRLVVNPAPGSPEATRPVAKGDRIVGVADSKRDFVSSGRRAFPEGGFKPGDTKPPLRKILVVGSGVKPRRVLEYLPGFLPAGSTVAATQPTDGIDAGRCRLERVTLSSNPEPGEAGPSRADIASFDSIVLVDDITDPDRHDAKVLMDLTSVYAAAARKEIDASVVVELLDYRNVDLAKAFGNMAAIVSSELVSNFLVQLAVEPDRGAVFKELLDAEGNEIYVRPLKRYLKSDDEELSFVDIMARARSLGEMAIGYVPAGDAPLRLSPRDRDSAKPASDYGPIVVVAEE